MRLSWKRGVLLLLAAFFAYGGVFLIGHSVTAYVRWGYPPRSHYVAGALFLATAILLPFRQTRLIGAAAGCCVLVPAAATCALHRDYGHAIQGIAIIVLVVWLALDRRP